MSTLTLQVQGPSRQAIVEKMSKAIHIAIGPNDAAATNNMPVTFIIEDEPAEGDAAFQASVSQCEGCTILSEEVKELRKTVYSVLRRLDDLSAKSKQNEAALEQKFDDTYDVIKDGVLINGHGIKAIKDEIKNSEDRLLQKLNSIHNSKQKDAEESNHALNHENTVERDNEGQWTKILNFKRNQMKSLIIGCIKSRKYG